MSVNPVDDRIVDLIFDGLVDGLVHQAFPLDDLLVLRANGVVPVDVEVRGDDAVVGACLLYTSPSPRDVEESRMPSSA